MEKKQPIHEIFLYLCRLQDEYTIVAYLEKDVSIDDTDDEGISLLHLASANGAERIVKLLLLKGAEVDKYTTLGWTPLMFAARNGCLQCVKLLVDHGANIYHQNKLGISILNMASASGSQDILEILLIATEQKALEQDNIIFSLQVAALYGHSCILHTLLRSYPHQVNNKDKYGMTPLMLATVGGHKEVIMLILDHGADQEVKNIQQFTALDFALAKGYKNLVPILEEKSGNRDICSKNITSGDVGTDLVEPYGWSSICTPKRRKGIKSRFQDNDTNSCNAPEMSTSALFQETKDSKTSLSSLFIPVCQSLCKSFIVDESNRNVTPSFNILSPIPVPPISPYSYNASPFLFSSTYPQEQTLSTSSLNFKMCNPAMLGNVCVKERNSKSSSCTLTDQNEEIQEKPALLKREMMEKKRTWGQAKVEKWLRPIWSLWQKNSKTLHRNTKDPKLSEPLERTQNSTFSYKNNNLLGIEETVKYDLQQDLTALSSFSTLKNLLVNLKLQAYIPLFQRHEIDIDSFFMLSIDDLKEIGISSPNSQSKLLNVILTFKGEN